MTRLELGPIGAWGHLDTFSAETARRYVRRIDELGYAAFWVPETVGREPFTLLGMLAGETSRLVLGTSIINIWGRDAQASRMGAMTLSEATAGRFVLGLGVSHPHLGKLRGHDYVRPLSRMREYLAAYRAAIYRGPATDGAPEPPVLLAALRERMTDLAATEADGAFPHLVTAERVGWMRDRLDAARSDLRPILAVSLPVALGDADAAGAAARAFLTPYLRAPNYRASWELQGFGAEDWEPPISDRLVDAMVALGSAAVARERIAALREAGADHVAILPLAPDGATEHLPTLEALA
jgi:probable F420-dependent oxidoreductase